jgi:hypothetical protein
MLCARYHAPEGNQLFRNIITCVPLGLPYHDTVMKIGWSQLKMAGYSLE